MAAKSRDGADLQVQLYRCQDNVDRLVRDVAGGIAGPAHFDRLEGEAQQIGADLVAAFRGSRP